MQFKNQGGSQAAEIAQQISQKFDEFKQLNDRRLTAVESEKSALAGKLDDLTAQLEQLESLKSQMEDFEKKSNRPGTTGFSSEAQEHKDAFGAFMRKGTDLGLADLQVKALNITADADGGFAVPEELDRTIGSLLRNSTPMRDICNVVTMGGAEYKKLMSTAGSTSGWVGEAEARPETNTPKLALITPFMGELYANPQATQTMLDDVFFKAEDWLAGELATEFAEKENLAFTSGDGVKKPKGLLAYTTVATSDATRAFGTFEHINSASIGSVTADDLVKFAFNLRTGYLPNSIWQFNRNTLAALMVLKDSTGQYLWQPSITMGTQASLAGYKFVLNDDMPNVAAGANAIAFGAHKRAYTIVDRMGTRVLRDPFTNKPNIGFYTTKRVGGMAVDTQAVKFLKIRAS
jgi:HK97 family phage major capsid protein